MQNHMPTLRAVLMVLVVLMAAWGSVWVPLAFAAARALVAETGQTQCWDAMGSPMSCADTGQDEDAQAGVLFPTAWNDPEEFRGLRLGQSLKGQVQKCPRNFWETKERCWEQVGPPDAYGEVLYQLRNFGPIGDLPVGRMTATEVRDRLHSIMITMSHDLYPRLRDVVLQRYGPPTSEHTEEVVTKAGVKWPNKTMIWRGSSIIVELVERVVRADETTLHAYTSEFVDHFRRKRSEQQRKGVSDL